MLSIAENKESSVENTFNFVNKASEKLKLTKHQDIILVVGNTGSDKSTLVHVVGDFDQLKSIEPELGDEYTFKDGLDCEINLVNIIANNCARNDG